MVIKIKISENIYLECLKCVNLLKMWSILLKMCIIFNNISINYCIVYFIAATHLPFKYYTGLIMLLLFTSFFKRIK
jgi:hypothetical protein